MNGTLRGEKDKNMEAKEDSHVELQIIDEGNGSVICFRNVTYVIDRMSLTKILPPRVILKNVSGIMRVGLNAIMGPTGSGKTSLLDVLADRKAKKGLSGNILINGKRQPHNFKCASAYVVQDDVVVGTLTVRENLIFSALLRLPMSYTWKERKDKVNTMISDLNLRKVADDMVGTEILRGISGGERKRTALGMELIISPQFVFLDEPTSGMDTTTAMSIISLLKDLSAAGRVIVLAIHQPCYPIYKLFDSLTILHNGETVYHGPTANALNYFARIGYQCEKHNNPADFFLDIISTSKTSEAPEETNLFITAFKKSYEYEDIQMILEPIVAKALNESRGTAPQFTTYFLWQVLMVAIRTTLNIIRDPLLAFMQVFIMALCGILAGIIFYNVDHSFDGVQNRIGGIFFIELNLIFANLASVETFVKERIMFKHENTSGYYSVAAYFLARVMVEFIILRFLPTIVLAAVSYWMVGFQAEASKFFIYLLTLTLTSMATCSVAFFYSALVKVFALANFFTAVTFIIMSMFTGFLVNINSIPIWLSWLQYLSIFRHSLHTLAENELDGEVYCDQFLNFDNVSSVSMYQCIEGRKIDGTTFLDDQQFNQNPIWINLLALLTITSVSLIGTYVALRLMKKEK